jgi:two-component system CheB/CheR fusion protein
VNEQDRDPAFEELLVFLRDHRGFDFTGYKRSSLMRRVRRRMEEVGVEGFRDYRDYLEVHPNEFAYLFNTILINVTSFFRDQEPWDYLAGEVVPRIIENVPEGNEIRVWSAGCAGGEEAYTLAMVFAEALGVEETLERLKIYATDVDEDALAQARQGGYRPEATEPIPEEIREKYFDLSGGLYIFRSDLRRTIVFGRHDLIQDAPISRLDLLVCRNTLIYLNAETQRQVLARFHFALKDDGFLFLGRAEMLLTHSHLFRPVQDDYRIFSKVPIKSERDRMVVLTQAGNRAAASELGSYVQLREAAFGATPLAQVVVDREGNLALANEAARAWFTLQDRDLGRPFHDLELSYRPAELRGPMKHAKEEGQPVKLEDVERRCRDKEAQYLDIVLTPLHGNGRPWVGMSIYFKDVTDRHTLQEKLDSTREELETAYEEVQSTNEELETTNEELQSTVEELQTTNEELRSTNEEMETINEELRTTNADLQTKNKQLARRTEELDQANALLESILASVDAGLAVIDSDFEILVWNQAAEEMWHLSAEEAEGRSFLSLDAGLPVDELVEPVRDFLAGDVTKDRTIVRLDASNAEERSIEVHISELRRGASDATAHGVVLMMHDVRE